MGAMTVAELTEFHFELLVAVVTGQTVILIALIGYVAWRIDRLETKLKAAGVLSANRPKETLTGAEV